MSNWKKRKSERPIGSAKRASSGCVLPGRIAEVETSGANGQPNITHRLRVVITVVKP